MSEQRPTVRIPGLRAAVAALVRTVVVDALGGPSRLNGPALTETVAVILRRIYLMPRFLSIPMRVLTIIFDWFGIVSGGRRFHKKTPERQKAQLDGWRRAPFGFCDNFVDFYTKMSTFAYFHLAEHRAGTGETVSSAADGAADSSAVTG